MQDKVLNSARHVGATRGWCSLALAIGLTVSTIGCTDGPIDTKDPDPPTGQTEQEIRDSWCDYDYFNAAGQEIGWCFVPCLGAVQCSGITPPNSQIKRIEFSCEECR